MKIKSLTAALLLTLSSIVHSAEVLWWNPPPIVTNLANAVWQYPKFTNPTGQTIYIKKVQVLLYPGEYDIPGTFTGHIYRYSDGNRITYWSFWWNEYSYAYPPTQDYGNNYLSLAANDSLGMVANATGFDNNPGFLVVDIWYTLTP